MVEYSGKGFGLGLLVLGVVSLAFTVIRLMAGSCSYPEL